MKKLQCEKCKAEVKKDKLWHGRCGPCLGGDVGVMKGGFKIIDTSGIKPQ